METVGERRRARYVPRDDRTGKSFAVADRQAECDHSCFTNGRTAVPTKIVKKMELSRVLEMVRAELIKANDAAFASKDPIMVFDECELEFAVSLEEELNVGFKVYFVQLGGKQKKSDTNTVTIKYKALKARGLVAEAGGLETPAEPSPRQTPRPGSG
jgi:hypothetical protein